MDPRQNLGLEELELEAALEEEANRMASGNLYSHQKHSYLSRSKYIVQIDRYEKLFPKQQMLILKSEDLFSQPQKVWNDIQEFLGLKKLILTKHFSQSNAGEGEASKIDQSIRKYLQLELKSTVTEIESRYGFNWGW